MEKELQEFLLDKAVIVGHRDQDGHKACPCFDGVRVYQNLEP